MEVQANKEFQPGILISEWERNTPWFRDINDTKLIGKDSNCKSWRMRTYHKAQEGSGNGFLMAPSVEALKKME